jgi:hypothetical protein
MRTKSLVWCGVLARKVYVRWKWERRKEESMMERAGGGEGKNEKGIGSLVGIFLG